MSPLKNNYLSLRSSSMKVITVCDTLPYGHAPTYHISLTYLEKQLEAQPTEPVSLTWQSNDTEANFKGR